MPMIPAPVAPAPSTPTRLILPDTTILGPGDIPLVATNNMQITKDAGGTKAQFAASSPQPSRGFGLFVPGTLTALGKFGASQIPQPILQQLDWYMQNAPAGVTGASTATLTIAGSVSGSATWQLLTQEGHAGPSAIASPVASVTGSSDGTTSGARMGLFTPSSTLSVTAVTFGQWGNKTNDGMTLGLFTAASVGLGALITGAVPLTDSTGANAVTHVANQATAVAGDGTITANFPGTVTLQQGTTYAAGWYKDNLPSNANGAVTGGAADFSPVTAGLSNSVGRNQASLGATTWSNDAETGSVFFKLFGGILGLVMQGTINLTLGLTGAPATPGGNMNVGIQV